MYRLASLYMIRGKKPPTSGSLARPKESEDSALFPGGVVGGRVERGGGGGGTLSLERRQERMVVRRR